MKNKFGYLLVALLYLLGLATLVQLSYLNLKTIAANDRDWIVDDMDNSLSEIRHYYQNLLLPILPVKNCETFLKDAKPLLLSSPYIRSVNAAKGGVITCSTISGSELTQISNWKPSTKTLELRYVAKTPYAAMFSKDKQGILSLHFEQDHYYGVYVAVYPELVFKLIGRSKDYDIIIRFENATFSPNGSIVMESNPLPKDKLYDVSYKIPLAAALEYSADNYGVLALFWTLLVLFFANSFIDFLNTYNIQYWRIRRAIAKRQFHPYVQPVFTPEGEISGGEVLVRWRHPKRGLIPPFEFIDAVEKNGQIVAITNILMEKCVTAFAKANIAAKEKSYRIGFNVCPIQFEGNQLLQDIDHFQQTLADKPIKLLIEVTERHEFADNVKYQQAIHSIRSRNILVALDDFGTGHCSLTYLHEVEIDIIKIDMMFVQTIDNGSHTKILDSIIGLARSMNIPLLAEGIETQRQFNYLKAQGIERYQGYLLGKPIPLEDFIEKYMTQQN